MEIQAQNAPQARPKVKAIALMSGGLDSTLAAKVIQDQGVEVIGLHLLSPFGCREDVQKGADALGIKLVLKEKGAAYLDLVKNPRFGYGKNLNPCIDCRIFMFQLADIIRQEEGAEFIVTGEVLGQRPMSQQRHSMEKIDKHSPLEGLIVRPLSAHCFSPSIPEQKGWVDRDALFRISGRGRRPQLELAEKLGLSDYSAPGGGCLLTESAFSNRLKDLFEHPTHTTDAERLTQSEMLRLGRHFRLNDQLKVIIGRDQGENIELGKLWAKSGGAFITPGNFEGPVAVSFGKAEQSDLELIGQILARYGKSQALAEKQIRFQLGETRKEFTVKDPVTDSYLETVRL